MLRLISRLAALAALAWLLGALSRALVAIIEGI